MNAGVNAAANRIFYPSHFSSPHYGYSSGYNSGYGGSSGSTTHIVHNNYYNSNPSSDSQGAKNNIGDSTHSDNPNNSNNQNQNNQNSNNPSSSNFPHIANRPHYANTPNHSNNSNSLNNNEEGTKNLNANELGSNSSHQQLKVSDDELRHLTEDLFSRQEFDVNKYIKLNLQKRVNSTNITDESIEP